MLKTNPSFFDIGIVLPPSTKSETLSIKKNHRNNKQAKQD